MSGPESAPEPSWATADPERFLEAVRASDGPVKAVRVWTTQVVGSPWREEPFIRVHYAVRAETEEGWGTFRYTEHLPVETATGRIAACRGTVWRTLREEARDRLYVDRSRSGAL